MTRMTAAGIFMIGLGAISCVASAQSVQGRQHDLTERPRPTLNGHAISNEIQGEIYSRTRVAGGENRWVYVGDSTAFYIEGRCSDNDNQARSVRAEYSRRTMIICTAESTNDNDDAHDVNTVFFYKVKGGWNDYVRIETSTDGTHAYVMKVR